MKGWLRLRVISKCNLYSYNASVLYQTLNSNILKIVESFVNQFNYKSLFQKNIFYFLKVESCVNLIIATFLKMRNTIVYNTIHTLHSNHLTYRNYYIIITQLPIELFILLPIEMVTQLYIGNITYSPIKINTYLHIGIITFWYIRIAHSDWNCYIVYI